MRQRDVAAVVAVLAAALGGVALLRSVTRVERTPKSNVPASISDARSPDHVERGDELAEPPAEREQALDRAVVRTEPAPERADPAVRKSVTLRGRVIDRAGQPVAGAELFTGVKGRATHGVRVATTDGRGEFRIAGFAGKAYAFRIVSDDHPDLLAQGSAEEAGRAGLEFVLADGAEIAGRVVGAPDDVLAGLWVRAERSAASEVTTTSSAPRPFRPLPRWTRCASDGSFAVRGLEPALPVRLAAFDEQGVSLERPLTQVVEVTPGSAPIELAYRPPTGIVCQVVDTRTLAPVTTF